MRFKKLFKDEIFKYLEKEEIIYCEEEIEGPDIDRDNLIAYCKITTPDGEYIYLEKYFNDEWYQIYKIDLESLLNKRWFIKKEEEEDE